MLGRIFESYKNKKVPDPQFFQNALVRDFGVPRDQAAKCAAIFQDNVEFLGLLRQASTGKWLAEEPSEAIDMQTSDSTESEEAESDATPISESRGPSVLPPARATGSASETPAKNAIFVGHGKNKVPLQQLEKFLSEYKIPHKVAIDEQIGAVPFPKRSQS